MPSDTIIGKDVLLYFLVNGIYQQAACATECSLNVHTDIVEVTTKTSNAGQGTWRKVKPVFNSWSASVSGVQLLDTPVKFSDIRQFQTDLTPIYIQYAKVSQSGTRYENWFGKGVITDTDETAAVDDFATFAISIEGNGVLTADFDPTNLDQPTEMYYYYTATGTEGRSWIIPDLANMIPAGRIYRDGRQNDPSGNETTDRPATATPIGSQYKWDVPYGRITLAEDDPAPEFKERFTIPYTQNYSGCTLAITNFKVALDTNNHFAFTWTGTGIPESQLLFEYSDDYGLTYTTIDTDIDTVNLDNAVYNEDLDTSAGYIWRLTPICTNAQKGKPSQVYWNATAVTIQNNRTDGIIITFLGFAINPTTDAEIDCSDDEVTQKTYATINKNPYSGTMMLLVYLSSEAYPCEVIVKKTDGTTIGTASTTSPNSGLGVPLSERLPNEFIVIMN